MRKHNLFQEWFDKADEDELSINAILTEKGAPSTACFLSQQMGEKYLKGFLVFHEKEFPKIHQLEKLLNMCKEIDNSFEVLKDDAVLLSEFYVETRYPGDVPEGFSWNDARKAFESAKKIKDFVLERVVFYF